jgi:pheromone shutdown protein TraB
MYNITLIGTNHSEFGKCNSNELYNIIAAINPEVIFEELSPILFNFIYNSNSNNLTPDVVTEIKCVKKYLKNHNISHEPVDIDLRYISDKEQDWMFDAFEKYDAYKKIDYEQYLLAEKNGFDFLNSKKSMNLFEKQKIIKTNIIEVDNQKNELSRIYQLFTLQDDIRENAMLKNIYNYSKENQFNQAVFLIGTAHKKSIMQKITKYEKQSEVKLKWTMYGNENKTYR